MCLCWRAVGGTVGGGGGGPTHPNRTREKTQRPDQRPFLASWGAEREGGELVLETAREGGTSPGLPSI